LSNRDADEECGESDGGVEGLLSDGLLLLSVDKLVALLWLIVDEFD
jgi:hypothetical protein